jgi:hypothetical protein
MARNPLGIPRTAGKPPYDMLKEGGDGVKATEDIYNYMKVRISPDGKPPRDLDYRAPERAPHRMSPAPDWEDYRAGFHEVKDTPVSKPLDESGPQFRDSKPCHLNDTANTWVRGYGQRPAFDSGPSGFTYDKRRK